MSDSVRISALSSSTTRTGSGSAAVANLIEDFGDVIDRKRLLQIGVDPIFPEREGRFGGSVWPTAVHDERGLGGGFVYLGHRHAGRNRVDVHVQQHGDRTLHRHET